MSYLLSSYSCSIDPFDSMIRPKVQGANNFKHARARPSRTREHETFPYITMYDFTEGGSNSSAAVSALAWDDEGFGDDSPGLRSAEEHKLESERTWGLMNDQFTNVSIL